MTVLPGLDDLLRRAPALRFPAVQAQLGASFAIVFAATLVALLLTEAHHPFVGLLVQAVFCVLVLWIVRDFYSGPERLFPFEQALLWRQAPAWAITAASLTSVLFTRGAEAESVVPLWVSVLTGLYLLVTAAVLGWRTLQALGIAGLLGATTYHPDDARRVDWEVTAIVRHPGTGAVARLILAMGLWNGSPYALLLAVALVWIFLPAWVRLDDDEQEARLGEAQRRARIGIPALFPRGLGAEAELLAALLHAPEPIDESIVPTGGGAPEPEVPERLDDADEPPAADGPAEGTGEPAEE